MVPPTLLAILESRSTDTDSDLSSGDDASPSRDRRLNNAYAAVRADVPPASSSTTMSSSARASATGVHSKGSEPKNRHATLLKAEIVGGVFGGIFVLLLFLVAVCFSPSGRRRSRKKAVAQAETEGGPVEGKMDNVQGNTPVPTTTDTKNADDSPL
ncbi:hypothetical protein C8F01DRAFT_1250279 [Mycena amicta]|nr:hypothetical protein C8F01DRAFT_1250279 [Mycena amicta]